MKKLIVKRLAFSIMTGVVVALTSMSALADAIEIAFDAGRQAGKDECKTNPSSCGIDVAAFERAVKEGCQNNPSSCGIDTIAFEQIVKEGCKIDPISCGIASKQDGIEQCKNDPSSCGIDFYVPPQMNVGSIPPEDCASESAGENCISLVQSQLYLPRAKVLTGGEPLLIDKLGMDMFQGEDLTFLFVYKLYTLKITKEGDGTVDNKPKAILPCEADVCVYGRGTVVILTANATTAGSTLEWTGDCQGESSSIPIIMDSNKECKVIFK